MTSQDKRRGPDKIQTPIGWEFPTTSYTRTDLFEELEAKLEEAKSRIYAAERRADTVSALTRRYAEDRLAGYKAMASHDWDTLVAWHEDNGQTLTHNVLEKLSEMATELLESQIKVAELEADKAEHAKLRTLFEELARKAWDASLDGSDFQDEAERLGLLVEVPASQEVRDEYDTDVMFAWVWSDAAREEKG